MSSVHPDISVSSRVSSVVKTEGMDFSPALYSANVETFKEALAKHPEYESLANEYPELRNLVEQNLFRLDSKELIRNREHPYQIVRDPELLKYMNEAPEVFQLMYEWLINSAVITESMGMALFINEHQWDVDSELVSWTYIEPVTTAIAAVLGDGIEFKQFRATVARREKGGYTLLGCAKGFLLTGVGQAGTLEQITSVLAGHWRTQAVGDALKNLSGDMLAGNTMIVDRLWLAKRCESATVRRAILDLQLSLQSSKQFGVDSDSNSSMKLQLPSIDRIYIAIRQRQATNIRTFPLGEPAPLVKSRIYDFVMEFRSTLPDSLQGRFEPLLMKEDSN
ncbi:hypothetical protein IC617_08910 [Neiella sp. HB171785]|uniref:Uncharacterized protein n=1 Tax=Neiella litorisoli TaxID=2771431 RepID=A0A8J6QJD3_9GAMM|nr:hypothetical protein [Neiella litorisoli]MBD1389547.1 hypothetical protein [Neiella litorisoli]